MECDSKCIAPIVGGTVAGAVVLEAVTILIAIGCCIHLKRKIKKRYNYTMNNYRVISVHAAN